MRQRPWSQLSETAVIAWIAFVVACTTAHVNARAGDPDSATQAAREHFFEQNVRPLLAEKCYSCHGDKKQKGGLRLDSLEAILKGGESGPAVVAGKPDESLIVEAINFLGPEMPPNGKLSPAKVAVLTQWVLMGTPWPWHDRGRMPPNLASKYQPPKTSSLDRSLWSLQPVRRSVIPQHNLGSEDWAGWSRNPIERVHSQSTSRTRPDPCR